MNSTALYKSIFDLNPIPMWIFDRSSLRFLDVNDAALRNYGYSRDEMLSMTLRDIRPPEEIERLETALGESPDVSTRVVVAVHRRKDGSVLTVEVRAQAIEYAGRPARLVTSIDIGERKRAEEELQREQDLWAAYLDTTPDSVYFKDRESRFTKINAAQAVALGVTSIDQVIGKTDADFFPADFAAKTLAEERQLMATGQVLSTEERVRAKDGTVRMYSTIKVPIRNRNGVVMGLVGTSRDITDERHTENAMREATLKYEALMNSLEGLVFEVDTATRQFLFVNTQTERLLGYPASRWLDDNRFWLERIHPDDREMVSEFMASQVRQGGSPPIEFRLLKADGSTLWVRALMSVQEEDGAGERLRGILIDITDRKNTEMELLRLSEQHKHLLNISQAVLVDLSLDDVLRTILHRLDELIAYDSCGLYMLDEEHQLLRPFLLIKPEGISELLNNWSIPYGEGIMSSVLQSGKGELVNDAHLDPRSVYPEGVVVVREHLISVPIVTHGKPIGVIFVSRRSERKFIKQELETVELFINQMAFAIDHAQLFEQVKASEERYRALFEESRDAVFISSPEGRFIDINPAGVAMFGYASKEELLKLEDLRVLFDDPGDRERYIREIEERGFVKDFALSVKGPNGETRHLLETATAVRNSEGTIIAYRGILRDITELRALQQRLLQAQKLESLGTLAGGIAHDFNNILAIIIAYTSSLQRSKGNEETIAKGLDTIKKASWRGAELVRQILMFARKTETISELVDLNNQLSDIVRMLSETMPRTITFVKSLTPNLPHVLADPNQIHQAIVNLCVNARDAMSDGGTITLTTSVISADAALELFPEATKQPYVTVTISDTGAGMPEDVQRRIFEPFFTTKGQGKGTGLGLAMVYGIIQNHQGFINVRSAVGMGSAFTLYLPVPPDAVAKFEQPMVPAEVQEHAEGTLMLIEDEPMLRDFVQSLLEGRGYTVLTATDGMQAISLFRTRHKGIDLVFTDMGLPGMNGWETVQKLRQVRPELKVIFATGYLDPETKNEILNSGNGEFIQKPYLPEEILKKIRSVLDEKK